MSEDISDLLGLPTPKTTRRMPPVKKVKAAADNRVTHAPIPVKLMNPRAHVPEYATDGSACMDLFNCGDFEQIAPGKAATMPIGWAFQLPPDSVMLIFSRSGHGFKSDVRLANCVGVIDSDYRGEVKVRLTNDSDVPFKVEHHDRIAQALVLRGVTREEFVMVEELEASVRGEGGFGSSGA